MVCDWVSLIYNCAVTVRAMATAKTKQSAAFDFSEKQ